MRFLSLEPLVQAYLKERPDLSRQEAEGLARDLRRALDRLNRNWVNSQKRYHQLVYPGDPQYYFGESRF